MTTLQLLEIARERDITLRVDGDRLKVDGPVDALTKELEADLACHKPTLMAYLSPSRFVTLKGGLTIPAAALVLALDLEQRGISLAVDGNGDFVIPTTPALLPADRAAIRQWRRHLAALIVYRVPDDDQPQ